MSTPILLPTPTSSAPSLPTRAVETFHRTVLANRWIPHKPTAKQALFLLHDGVREVLYGGAAGGGKTDALLMAALQYADVPGYSSLLLMRSYSDLSLPRAGMSRAAEWLSGTGAHWSGDTKTWRFPSGASLTFGYLADKGTEQRYRTAEFQTILFDELTLFDEAPYRFLFSRLRKLLGHDVPLRMRGATNPGGRGSEWVRKRFVPDAYLKADPDARFDRVWWKRSKENGKDAWRLFVPARLEDNAHLDQADYEESLGELMAIEFQRLRHGDWQAHADGRFQRDWFRRYRDIGDAWKLLDGSDEWFKKSWVPVVTTCDPANRQTKVSKYTSCCTLGALTRQRVLVLHMLRKKLALEQIVPELAQVCRFWRPLWLGIEANGFQIALANEARKHPDIPTVKELQPEGKSKLTRATPAILRAQQGLIYVPEEADWLDDFFTECCSFTGDDTMDVYTDQVDTLAYAILGLDRYPTAGDDEPMTVGPRRGQR